MADGLQYSPMDRRSFSADDAAQSLLSQDEKGYMFERKRPARKRFGLAWKALLLLLVLVVHAGLVVFLASWLASSFLGAAGRSKSDDIMSSAESKVGHGHSHGHGHGDSPTCESEESYRQFSFDGVVPAVYKDPDAEFIHKDPCGSTAAEARARGCRYGMLYGAWLHESCYDEETEQRFKEYTNWRFWLQPNRTEEVSWDEVAKGEYEYVLVEWECKYHHSLPRRDTEPRR